MSDEHKQSNPAWVENTALTAPALLGAATGLLMGDLMHRSARRGLGIGIGVVGIALLAPYVFGEVRGLITGPRSKLGVRRRIQSIRDAGMGQSDQAGGYDEVEEELRQHGVV
jgi:hypothetical protein